MTNTWERTRWERVNRAREERCEQRNGTARAMFACGLATFGLALALTLNIGQVYQQGVTAGQAQGAHTATAQAYQSGYDHGAADVRWEMQNA